MECRRRRRRPPAFLACCCCRRPPLLAAAAGAACVFLCVFEEGRGGQRFQQSREWLSLSIEHKQGGVS